MNPSLPVNPDLPAVGLVAGRGRYPLLFCEEAKAHGVAKLVVVAMHGETEAAIEKLADVTVWVYVGQINKAIRAMLDNGVRHVVFAGQVKPSRLFTGFRPDLRALKVMAGLPRKNADTIFGAIGQEFGRDGLSVLPATTYLEKHLAAPGQMGSRKLKKEHFGDIELGRQIAREISRLDIGQTVVVKEGTVLAVEGFEGTDKAIRRGGELGHGGVTVVKVAKPGQNLCFDVPCIGLNTVESLVEAKAEVLALEAGKTLLVDRPLVQKALDKAGIVTVGITLDQPFNGG